MKKIIGLMVVSICLLVSSISYSQSYTPPNVDLNLYVFDADTGREVRPMTRSFGLIVGIEYHVPYGDSVINPSLIKVDQVYFKNIFGKNIAAKMIDSNTLVEENLALAQGQYKHYLGTFQLLESDRQKLIKGMIVTASLNLGNFQGGYLASEVIQYYVGK